MSGEDTRPCLDAGGRYTQASALVGLMLAGIIVVVVPVRLAWHGPNLQAAIGFTLPLCAVLTAWMVYPRFHRSRRLSDALVVIGMLLIGAGALASYAGPEILGGKHVSFESPGAVIARLAVGVVMAGAALAPRSRLVRSWREVVSPPALIAALVILIVIVDLAIDGHASRSIQLAAAASCLMLIAALGFARAGIRGRQPIASRLACASALLAIAWVYALRVPEHAAGTVTLGDLLRAAAYAFLVAAGLAYRKQLNQSQADEAAGQERRRLLGDLHDGLAQDLAFIAAHGNRLAPDLGERHPIVIAARRALEASRGSLVDLSAANAPTPEAALRAVAHEISSRSGVEVRVAADSTELSTNEREELIRIAREAIVNAVRHGSARHVDVTLRRRRNALVLSVDDDGCGISAAGACDAAAVARGSYGLATMRQRAATLGGRLHVRARERGGTVVEVLVP